MVKIIECVPNFSEGVDTEVIIFLLQTFRNLQHSWVLPVKLLFYNQRHCVIKVWVPTKLMFLSSRQVIEAIAAAVRATQGATLLDVDPGQVQVQKLCETCKNLPEWHQREQSHLVDQSDSVHVRWRPRQHCWSCSCSCQGDRKHLLKKYLVLVWQENSRLFVNGALSVCHILYDSQRLPSKGSTCASIKENIQGRHRSANEMWNL